MYTYRTLQQSVTLSWQYAEQPKSEKLGQGNKLDNTAICHTKHRFTAVQNQRDAATKIQTQLSSDNMTKVSKYIRNNFTHTRVGSQTKHMSKTLAS